jgi:signal transduction histidine kinase
VDGVEDHLFLSGHAAPGTMLGLVGDLSWVTSKLGAEAVQRVGLEEKVQLSVRNRQQTGLQFGATAWKVDIQSAGAASAWWRGDLLAFAFVTLSVLGVLIMGVVLLARDVARETNLNQMRADLVSGVSHELKTPLSVIRVYAETIDDVSDATAQERRHFAQAIVQETDRLRRLIDDVVDFSRIQQGQRQYRFTIGSLSDVVGRTVEQFRRYAELHGFTVTTTIASDLPPVAFDAVSVEQAVMNLLDNAAKYSGDSTVIVVRVFESAGRVTIEVEDKGVGIPADEQPRIFERFTRGAHPDRGGYGLGLYLVRHIARAHGGEVEVTSTTGEGSCFRLQLPVADPDVKGHEHAQGLAG